VLPDLPTVPEEYRDRPYTLCGHGWLLGSGEDNPKLSKSEAGGVYRTWGLTLAPAKSSGHQTCPSSSPGCRAACLFYQGQGRVFPSIAAARVARTVAWVEHRDWFTARLRWELGRIARRAAEADWLPAVRLNVMSDISWERALPWVFEDFGAIQFYDYTKQFRRMVRWCDGRFPANYHLTFSRSEANHAEAVDVVRRGGTAAVVFRDRALPARWCGFAVQDGDATDLRFLDRPGAWVSLYAKGTARLDRSGFVVDGRRVPLA